MNPRKQSSKSYMTGTFMTALLVCSSSFTGWSLQHGAYASSNRNYQQDVPSVPIPEKPEDISPLLIGESIPDIDLQDTSGKKST